MKLKSEIPVETISALARHRSPRARGLALVALGAGQFLQSALPAQDTVPAAQATPSSQVNLQVIVVDSPVTAQEILDRLKKGRTSPLSRRKSQSIRARSSGGSVGVVDSKRLRPEVREALQGLKPGQITGAIKVPSGYVILKVLPEKEGAAGQDAGQATGMGSNRNLHLAGKGAIQYPGRRGRPGPRRDALPEISQAGELEPGLARYLRRAQAVARPGRRATRQTLCGSPASCRR